MMEEKDKIIALQGKKIKEMSVEISGMKLEFDTLKHKINTIMRRFNFKVGHIVKLSDPVDHSIEEKNNVFYIQKIEGERVSLLFDKKRIEVNLSEVEPIRIGDPEGKSVTIVELPPDNVFNPIGSESSNLDKYGDIYYLVFLKKIRYSDKIYIELIDEKGIIFIHEVQDYFSEIGQNRLKINHPIFELSLGK